MKKLLVVLTGMLSCGSAFGASTAQFQIVIRNFVGSGNILNVRTLSFDKKCEVKDDGAGAVKVLNPRTCQNIAKKYRAVLDGSVLKYPAMVAENLNYDDLTIIRPDKKIHTVLRVDDFKTCDAQNHCSPQKSTLPLRMVKEINSL